MSINNQNGSVDAAAAAAAADRCSVILYLVFYAPTKCFLGILSGTAKAILRDASKRCFVNLLLMPHLPHLLSFMAFI